MERKAEVIFRGATVVSHDGTGARDIAVADGRILAVGELGSLPAAETVDCRGLHILPGVIDSHVHMREPGFEQKEDFETGGRAAVMGGVTAVFEMPNAAPLTVNAATLADKLRRATGRMHCDFAFYVGGTRENTSEIDELERLPGCAGIKVFMGSSTGELLMEDDDSVARLLGNATRRVAFHSEDEFRLRERSALRVAGDPASHPVWRDPEAARLCTERLLRLARRAGKRIHLLHLSTAEEIPLLAAARDIATVEVTPHHLVFTSDDYARLGTRIQMNPPIRGLHHRDALWDALASGLIDTVGSDHAPHTLEEKARPYPQSPSGMPGVQTLVPVLLDFVARGKLSIERFVDLTSHGPARVFGIAGKGRIAEGFDADLTVVDLKRAPAIADDWIESRCGWTPYDGLETAGWPVGTVVRGRRAMWEGEIMGRADGRPVKFQEALGKEKT